MVESERERIRVAFQGGGAAVAGLLPVAQAFYNLSEGKRPLFSIDRVAGTSAGSIAGAILASGIPPVQFKDWITSNHTEYSTKLARPTFLFGAAFSLYWGYPLYSHEVIEKFIRNMFEAVVGKEFDDRFSSMKIALSICATDISNRDLVVYCSEKEVASRNYRPLSEAVADSCSIPFIFKGPKSAARPTIVDGGILDNLPVDALFDDDISNSSIFGVTVRHSQYTPDILKSSRYAALIVSNLIDGNVRKSLARVNDTNVIDLVYPGDAMDFDFAVNYLDRKFDERTRYFEAKIRAQYEPTTAPSFRGAPLRTGQRLVSSPDIQRSSASGLYSAFATSHITVENITIIYFLNTFSKQENRENIFDHSIKRYRVVPIVTNGIFAFKIFFSSSDGLFDRMRKTVQVVDDKKRPLKFHTLLGEVEPEKDGTFSHEVMLFIEVGGEPLMSFVEVIIDATVEKEFHQIDYKEDSISGKEAINFFSGGGKSVREIDCVFVYDANVYDEVSITPRDHPESHLNEKSVFKMEELEVSQVSEMFSLQPPEKIVRGWRGKLQSGENSYCGLDISVTIQR